MERIQRELERALSSILLPRRALNLWVLTCNAWNTSIRAIHSLILTAVDGDSIQVPSVLQPITLPANPPNHNTVTLSIIDTSGRFMTSIAWINSKTIHHLNNSKLAVIHHNLISFNYHSTTAKLEERSSTVKQLLSADVVILVCSFDKLSSFDHVKTMWFKLFDDISLSVIFRASLIVSPSRFRQVFMIIWVHILSARSTGLYCSCHQQEWFNCIKWRRNEAPGTQLYFFDIRAWRTSMPVSCDPFQHERDLTIAIITHVQTSIWYLNIAHSLIRLTHTLNALPNTMHMCLNSLPLPIKSRFFPSDLSMMPQLGFVLCYNLYDTYIALNFTISLTSIFYFKIIQQLKPDYIRALDRIFRVFDQDNDHMLNDKELAHFQEFFSGIESQEVELCAIRQALKRQVSLISLRLAHHTTPPTNSHGPGVESLDLPSVSTICFIQRCHVWRFYVSPSNYYWNQTNWKCLGCTNQIRLWKNTWSSTWLCACPQRVRFFFFGCRFLHQT